MASVRERIASAREALVGAGIAPADAALDAEVLARHVLGWDRAQLVARGRDEAPPDFGPVFERAVSRRTRHEPIAYIVGHREFWELDFEVTPDVLIPRPETELIVEGAIDLLRTNPPQQIVDVCTGSGCLAVALAREFPAARVIATDISHAALGVARRNAERHGVADRVEFRLADVLTGVQARADLMVSNPPYVPASAAPALPVDVVQYEPHLALFAEGDGLEVIRRILSSAGGCLAPDGLLMMEFGYGQEEEVRAVATPSGWQTVKVLEDLQGIARTIVLRRSRG
jgi:release factor glutamine methyltransferase